jgi:HSP20 family protein
MTLMKFQKQPVRTGNFPVFSDLFSDLFDGMVNSEYRSWNTAAVNIREDASNFYLEVAAPGTKKDDFKLNVNENVLRISASSESSDESTASKGRYTRKEFSCHSFSRSFTLPETVNIDGIEASYDNGIMQIRLPKREEAKPKFREISIS